MKKCLAILLLILVVMSCPVYGAEGITSDTASVPGKVVLSGTMEGHEDGEFVVVHAFKKDRFLVPGTEKFDKAAAYNALALAADKRSVLAYHDQTSLKNGKFKFTIKISGNTPDETVSGVYTAVLQVGNEALESDFLYIDSGEQTAAFSKLDALKQIGEETRFSSLVTILDQNPYTLGFYCDLLNNVSKSAVYQLFYDYLEGVQYNVSDKVNTTKAFRKLIVIEAFNEGKIDSVSSYEQELLIAEGEMAAWYQKSLVDKTFKRAVTDRLKNKNFATLASYDAAFKEAMILEYVIKADGLGTVKNIVAAFAQDIAAGFTPSAYGDSAYRSIMGQSYGSYADMVFALQGAETGSSTGNNGNSSNTGRPGGSSGISLGGSTSVVVPGGSNLAPEDITGATGVGFTDLDTVPWAEEAILYLAEHGIVAGKSATEFNPNDFITREEFVKILVRALEFPAGEGTLPFFDVAAGTWYYDCICTAYINEIVKGITTATFGVGLPVTRQDMSVMLYEALLKKGIEVKAGAADAAFKDAALIADYAKEAVGGLQATGIVNGIEDGHFNPTGFTTRAEAAKVIYGVLSLLY